MIVEDSLVIQELVRYLSGAVSLDSFRDATVGLSLTEDGEMEGSGLLADIEALYFEFSSSVISDRPKEGAF